MMVNWSELIEKASEQKQAREEAERQALRDRAEKDRLKVEARQAELNRLAERMFESSKELSADLAEEEARHKEAVEDIKTRNRSRYGFTQQNSTHDQIYKQVSRELIEK